MKVSGTQVVAGTAAAAALGWFIWKQIQTDSPSKPSGAFKPPAATKVDASKEGELPLDEGVWIYFASQSGTAQAFSEELEEECAKNDIKSKVVDLEEFSPDDFAQHKCVLLMVATYGEGDPTDNSVEFFKWLQDQSLGSDTLDGVNFTVMGLGNRQYVHFNAMAKIADSHMERLGAKRFYDRGEGDDDKNIEEDWEQWKDSIWAPLREALGMSDQPEGMTRKMSDVGMLETADDVISKLQLEIKFIEGDTQPYDPLVQNGGTDVLGKWIFNASSVPVLQCDELRQKPDVSAGLTTKHLEVDISSYPAMEWKTADNLEVLPTNTDDDVAWFASRLGVQDKLESQLAFVRASGVDKAVKKPFPTPCTLKHALKSYCDLSSTPQRNAARKFAALAQDADDRAALDKILGDREAFQLLSTSTTRISMRNFFELYLHSAQVDFSTFLQLCPRMKNRPYTIPSSHRENPKRIGICVSMVTEELSPLATVLEQLKACGHPAPRAEAFLAGLGDAKTKSRPFLGACSTMLCTNVSVGDSLLVTAHHSGFRLPKKASAPIIMIGAGTGMAPFRAFVREFKAEGGIRPTTVLFFGCWKRDQDFIYRDELNEALTSDPPVLKELVTAFSREQGEKVYVQHRLKERSEDLKGWLKDGGHVYVCGSIAMGAAVRQVITEALGSEDHFKRLQSDGHFYEELW